MVYIMKFLVPPLSERRHQTKGAWNSNKSFAAKEARGEGKSLFPRAPRVIIKPEHPPLRVTRDPQENAPGAASPVLISAAVVAWLSLSLLAKFNCLRLLNFAIIIYKVQKILWNYYIF